MSIGSGGREPPLIALVGSDGSGKSTVGAALIGWMRSSRPTELCHLGKQTGNIGRWIARWPLVGRRVDRTLATKADRAKEPGGPGVATAVLIYLFSMRRVRRFKPDAARCASDRDRRSSRIATRRWKCLARWTGLVSPLPSSRASRWCAALAAREQRHYALDEQPTAPISCCG